METTELSVEARQDELLLEIHRLAHRIAKRVVRPRYVADEVAADVAQDVVLACLIRLRQGRWNLGDRALDSHIGCLVRRRWKTIRRQRLARMERDMIYLRDIQASVRPWMDPEAKVDEIELDELWAATLAKMPRLRRAAYELVRNRGWSYARAAEMLGISPKGVQSHVVRAQGAFRVALKGRGVVVPAEKRPRGRGSRWRLRKMRRAEVAT